MINLKSDLVNMPTDEMWEAMRNTTPGWVIDREDPTINRLEAMAARMVGKEAALFVMTGTLANLAAMMTLCNRGHQVILEENSHIPWCEEWGLSYVCGLFPRLVKGHKGILDPRDVELAITESRFSHTPPTDLLVLEIPHNGAGGTVPTLEQTQALCEVAHRHGASVLIDGARIFLAAAALGVTAAELVAGADVVWFSLVKGLSAPAGAMLCGSAEAMDQAHVNLRRLGARREHKGGILAAAGILALENMVDRLTDDLRRAKMFATALDALSGVVVDLESVQTNIVMADISACGLDSKAFEKRLMQSDVRAHPYTPEIIRFTFHRHITDEDVDTVIEAIRVVMQGS
jgi:threonine aldolase